MRVSREAAAMNRERVVATAGRQFREHGYEGVGLAGLMKAAGLTHGGFYKQFDDKEALVVEATEQALAENLDNWRKVLGSAADEPLAALQRWYLSDGHLAARGEGCAYATLAAEAPRHSKALRQTFADAIETLADLLCEKVSATGHELSRAQALRFISLMIGSLVLARAVEDTGLREEILASGRTAPR